MTYVPATFLIKGLMALVAFYGFKLIRKRLHSLVAKVLTGIAAEILMVFGYFVFEGFLYGFIPSAVNIPANGVQGIAGLVIGTALMKVLEQSKAIRK